LQVICSVNYLMVLSLQRKNFITNYAFVFVTLVHAMISTYEYQENDFRIRLVHELQKRVWTKFQELSARIFSSGHAFKAVNQDIERALGWTELIASKINDEYTLDELRVNGGFRIDKDKIKYGPKPHRTFDFKTRELIERK
jgi:uncharacterized protein YoaH (UPF0181 family)